MKMPGRLPLILSTLLLASIPFISARSADLTLETALKKKYVGLGMEFGANPVHQGVLTYEQGPFSLTGFLNRDIHTKETNEKDVMASATIPLGKGVEATVGGSMYNLPEENSGWDQIYEANGSVEFTRIPFSPTLSGVHFFDYGTYFSASGSKDVTIPLPFVGDHIFSFSGGIGYNAHAFRDNTGFSHLETEASTDISVPMPFGLDDMTITPSVSYSEPLSTNMDNQFNYGVNASITFPIK